MKKLLVLLCVLFAVPAWGVTEILLTVQEPTNHARTNGPVTSGIPLASGQQTSTWSLWKDGVEVPVGITPLDGASNWILLDFQTTVGAYSSETYILKDTSASASAPTLNKTEDASTITVDTGTSGAKWTIDKTNFDGFDGVYFDADSNGFTEGDRLITDNSAQITADDVETTNTYVTSRTDTATFAWEYDNAMRKTLKVTGQWYEGANPWAGAFYTVRFTWYAGRTDCLVEFIFRNSRNGDITHRKVDVLEFILSGASKTTVTATTSGSIEWEDVDSNGILWDLIPDSIYWNSGSQVDSSTNGGMVLLDWSHYSSILVIDADTTLSAGEKTAKDGAAKAPLFALAEPSRYSDHGEMSTRNHGTFEDERRSYRVWDWMYDAGNGNATGWDHPGTDGADEPKDVCATGTNNSIPTDWDSYCYGAGSSCCDPLTWETMSPHADMENPHLWHHIIMYVGGTRSIPEQEIGQRSYWDRARGWARYCKEQFAFRTDGFDWNWNTNYSQSTTANRGEGQCTVDTGEPPCDFNPTTADDTMLYNALEKYGQGRVCSPGRITDSGEGSPSGYFDDQGADHMFCWALADYYLLTGDTDAYDALGDLNEMSQYIFHDGKVPGSFAMSTGRREGRHLSAATRWTEISGEDATFRDKILDCQRLHQRDPPRRGDPRGLSLLRGDRRYRCGGLLDLHRNVGQQLWCR
jgi:hypothetical protein